MNANKRNYINSEVITWTGEIFTINKEVITPMCCFYYFYLTAKYEKRTFTIYPVVWLHKMFSFFTYLAYFLHFSCNTMEAFHPVC